MCHYLTQNSTFRAPLFWKADTLQMAIIYQLELDKIVCFFLPHFVHLFLF